MTSNFTPLLTGIYALESMPWESLFSSQAVLPTRFYPWTVQKRGTYSKQGILPLFLFFYLYYIHSSFLFFLHQTAKQKAMSSFKKNSQNPKLLFLYVFVSSRFFLHLLEGQCFDCDRASDGGALEVYHGCHGSHVIPPKGLNMMCFFQLCWWLFKRFFWVDDPIWAYIL